MNNEIDISDIEAECLKIANGAPNDPDTLNMAAATVIVRHKTKQQATSTQQDIPPRFGTPSPASDNADCTSFTGNVEVAGRYYPFAVNAAATPMFQAFVNAVAEVTSAHAKHMMEVNPQGKTASGLSRNATEAVRQLSVVMWLRSCGDFYRNAETRQLSDLMFFNRKTGRLLRIHSDEFAAWISNGARINRADLAFRQLIAFVEDAAMSPEVSQEIVPQAFVARLDNAVYVSSGEAQMVRLRDGRAEVVRNGTDGVLFPCEWTLRPWSPLPDNEGAADPFETAAQFRDLAYDTWYGKYLLRSWYLNLFACHANHAPLLLAGERNSGKTATARALREMAGFPVREAGIDPKKEEDFWVAVNGRGILLFDNVEEEVQSAKWLNTAIEKATTGGSKEVRKLYTQTATTYKPNANIVFASKVPHYAANEGVAHRFVIVNLNANIAKFRGDELKREIASRRDEFMTWTARTVARALVAEVKVPDNVNDRYPDFGDFTLRCASVLGDYDNAVKALQCGELEKSRIVLIRDHDAADVYRFLVEHGGRWEGNLLEIAQAMNADGIPTGEDGDRFLKRAAMRYAKAIARLRKPFEMCFKSVSWRLSAGRTRYEFGGLNDLIKGLL